MIESLSFLWSIALLLIVWIAAIKDMRSFTIPHIYPGLIILLWLLAVPVALMSFVEPVDLLWNLLTASIAFVIGFILFAFRLMGGGDVKLFTALALWIKISNLHMFVLFMVTLGLIYTILYAIWHYVRRRQNPVYSSEKKIETYRIIKRFKIPYGPAIALGLSAYLAILWA